MSLDRYAAFIIAGLDLLGSRYKHLQRTGNTYAKEETDPDSQPDSGKAKRDHFGANLADKCQFLIKGLGNYKQRERTLIVRHL